MPIRLGDPDSSAASGPFNHYALVILWILQFSTIAWFEFYLGISVLILGAFGNITFIFLLPIFFANLGVLYYIIREWRQLHADTLTSVLYYRFQVAKSAYCTALLLVLFVPAIMNAGFLSTAGKFVLFLVPFWGALGYAYKVRKDDAGFEGEGVKAWW